MSRAGLLIGTADSAGLPALLAATAPDAGHAVLYGPKGPGRVGGPPAEQELYRPLRDADAARRMWDLSQERAGVTLDGAATPDSPLADASGTPAGPTAAAPPGEDHGVVDVRRCPVDDQSLRSARSCCTDSA